MNKRAFFTALAALLLFSAATGQGLPTGDPRQFGLDPDRLARIDRHFQEEMSAGTLPGAVAIVARDGHVVYHGVFGYADRESHTPLTPDSFFRLASMTKPIISVATLMLHEQGYFQLTDPVSRFIPEFAHPRVLTAFNSSDTTYTAVPASREITIHDLLTHTSGIGYGLFNDTLAALYARAGIPDLVTARDKRIGEAVRALATLPLLHNPGEKWTYGLSDDVLGYLIEVVSGQPLDRFLRERVFQPLRMYDTYFYLPERKKDRLATLYAERDSSLIRYNQERMDELFTGVSPDYPVDGAQVYFSGGGGLSSTAEDYARFAQMLLNRGELDGVRILLPETVDRMTTNQIGDLPIQWWTQCGYGYGVWVAKDIPGANQTWSAGSYGWDGIFNTVYWADPKERLFGILMSQVLPTTYQSDQYQSLVYDALNADFAASDVKSASATIAPAEHLIGPDLVWDSGGDQTFRLLD